jgi:hypothetical protein
MSDPQGAIRVQTGASPGLSTTELAAAASHAANNIGALLVAATVFLDDTTGSAPSVRGTETLAAGIARLHTLSAALSLLSLEPAQVALVQAHPPAALGAHTLDRLRDELAREPQLERGSCPPMDDLPSRIDRGTLQSLLACMVECTRRRLPETRSACLSWSCTPDVTPNGVPRAAATWVFDVDVGAGLSIALYPPRQGIAEHALAHAAQLLAPLGVHLEAGPGDRHRLLLVATPSTPEGRACR